MLKLGEKGTILQRDKQTYAIAPHMPCGITTPAQLRNIADVAEKYNCQALKLTSAARIAIIGLQEEDIDQIWKDLGMVPGHAVGLCVRSIKVCPGTDYCRLGLQDSLTMGMRLDDRYHGMELPISAMSLMQFSAQLLVHPLTPIFILLGSSIPW